MRQLLLIFLITSISLFSQDEKRLALVIGNSNYEKGELKNPVNDARLIASTLVSLDFDVILKENLATKRDMTDAIREFGSRRSEYDVAFVYYAGHGIQVDDENFLLPTKEVFEKEFDVMDYGVSVQNIMRYLTAQTNEVNILILDACRDNPFETNWNTTRSLKGGGLAKIPPPTGSLIAFSTDSGQTAPDGDGENSTYTVSLAKNMLLEDTSIDQVFRNVRAEVLAQTDGVQRPVEATQLTGQTFYLNTTSYSVLVNKFEKLINEEKYLEALNLLNNYNSINNFDSNLYFLRSKAYGLLGEFGSAITDLKVSLKNDSLNLEKLSKKADYEYKNLDYINCTQTLSKIISISDSNVIILKKRSKAYADLNMKNESIKDLLAIKNINDDYKINESLGYQYGAFEDYSNSNKFYFISLEKLKEDYTISNDEKKSKIQDHYNKIGYNFFRLNELEKSKENHLKSLEYKNDCYKCFLETGVVFFELEEYNEAIEYFNEALKLNTEDYKLFYYRGSSYGNVGETELSIIDLNSAINLKNNDADLFFQRGLAFFRSEKYTLAIDDYTQAIKIDPENLMYYHNRGICYDEINEKEKAEADYIKALDKKRYRSYNSLGIFYAENNNLSEAEKYFKLSVQIAREEGLEEFCRALYNRAIFYFYILNNKNNAINDLNTAIKNDKNYLSAYELLSVIYKSTDDDENYLKNLNRAIELDLTTDLDYNGKKILRDNKNLINRALLFERNGKQNLSLIDYNEAININFSDPLPHYYLAKFYFRNNNLYQSLISITNAITLLKSSYSDTNNDENIYFIDRNDSFIAIDIRISELILFRALLYKKLELKNLACDEILLFNDIIDFSNYSLESSESPSIFIDLNIERKDIINQIIDYCSDYEP